ncbi:trehalase family glycosidase [Gloeocapsopsis dulcis]|nr:trehalase family glycosidase [Gloeocapsopsis dulcis]
MASLATSIVMQQSLQFPSAEQIAAIRAYIKQTWTTLSRSPADILAAADDPKIERSENTPWLVYVSAKEDRLKVEQSLQQILSQAEFNALTIKTLPADSQIKEHGLLYLPGSYVVPGGRFNEMFGWDSYFILLGLLQDQELDLAQSLVNQFVYEIEHYGTILNANRTYFLTRSQPPVLTLMVLALFAHTRDQQWLQSVLPAIEKYYTFWTTPPHLHPETGLSRFFDSGKGPAPEVISDEKDDAGRTHYDRILEYYITQKLDGLDAYYDSASGFTELFYQGDRSMRESGFDCSHRFGFFNLEITQYLPVCLNVLLYQMEQDIAQIHQILGDNSVVKIWSDRATKRSQMVDQLMWDEQAGLYFDYNFVTHQRSQYEFATTFYPLWVGIASPKQAEIVKNLAKFLAPGGLLTSTTVTGNQWDAPFGWAPLHLIAVQGLSRYHYFPQAEEIAKRFIALVVQEFEKYGVIVEKYDVVKCSANVSNEIHFGYSSNEIGFGWTNGVFLELLAFLDH